MRVWAVVTSLLLSLLGIADAVYLTILKVENSVTGKADSMICSALSVHGCSVALDSPMSNLFGVPVSVFALAAYVFLSVLAVQQLVYGRARVTEPAPSFARDAGSLMVLGAVIWSAVLGSYSAMIGSFCPFCVGLYGLNLGLLIVTRFTTNEWPFLGLFARIRRVFGATKRLAAHAAFFTAVVAATYGILAWQVALGRSMRLSADDQRLEQAITAGTVPMAFDGIPTKGPERAPIQLIKFSDLQCPHCRRYFEQLETFAAAEPSAIRIGFRHYPLSPDCNPFVNVAVHVHACEAAYAAVCADAQGKFFEFAGEVFAHQEALESQDLRAYAETVGIETALFDRCRALPETRAVVLRDVLLGRLLGVESTPTSLLNGLVLPGGLRIESLRHLVDALPKALPRAKVDPTTAVLITLTTPSSDKKQVPLRRLSPGDLEAPVIEVRVNPDTESGRANLKAVVELATTLPTIASVGVRIEPSAGCTPTNPACALSRRLACAWEVHAEIAIARAMVTEANPTPEHIDAVDSKLTACVAGAVPEAVFDVDGRALARFGTASMLVDGRPIDVKVETAILERAAAAIRSVTPRK